MILDALQWAGATAGIMGAPLVASCHPTCRRLGFAIWLGSNGCLIVWGTATGAWGLVAMQVFFCWSSWRGWRNNQPEAAP
jgi:hypothetical protein